MLSKRCQALLLSAAALLWNASAASLAVEASTARNGPGSVGRRSFHGQEDGSLGGADKYLLADFNRDGRTDLLSFADKFVVHLASHDGSLVHSFASGNCYGKRCSDIIWGTFAEDFDGDGSADILHFGQNLDVWLARGDGSFNLYHKASLDACCGSPCWKLPPVHLGDFDGDGAVDILKLGKNLDVWLAKGDGTFMPFKWTEHACYGRPCWELARVFVGDFNGDGSADILNIGDNLDVWLSEGNGHFGPQKYTPGGCYGTSCQKMWKVFVGDFNGDGKTDVLNLGDCLDVWLAKGDGTFHGMKWSRVCDGSCYEMSMVAVADFNGDSSADVMSVGHNLDVFLSRGDGTFHSRVSTSCGTDCKHCACISAVRTGDFNGDGNADAIGFSADGELLVVWLSKGDGTFLEGKMVLIGDVRSRAMGSISQNMAVA